MFLDVFAKNTTSWKNTVFDATLDISILNIYFDNIPLESMNKSMVSFGINCCELLFENTILSFLLFFHLQLYFM